MTDIQDFEQTLTESVGEGGGPFDFTAFLPLVGLAVAGGAAVLLLPPLLRAITQVAAPRPKPQPQQPYYIRA